METTNDVWPSVTANNNYANVWKYFINWKAKICYGTCYMYKFKFL